MHNYVYVYACVYLYIATDSWIKTKGACRYTDESFRTAAEPSIERTSLDQCKKFCAEELNMCDAFDTDAKGTVCHFFKNENGKKHTGDGRDADFCYVRNTKNVESSTIKAPALDGLYGCRYALCMCVCI